MLDVYWQSLRRERYQVATEAANDRLLARLGWDDRSYRMPASETVVMAGIAIFAAWSASNELPDTFRDFGLMGMLFQ